MLSGRELKELHNNGCKRTVFVAIDECIIYTIDGSSAQSAGSNSDGGSNTTLLIVMIVGFIVLGTVSVVSLVLLAHNIRASRNRKSTAPPVTTYASVRTPALTTVADGRVAGHDNDVDV